jgi:hypothetical protein
MPTYALRVAADGQYGLSSFPKEGIQKLDIFWHTLTKERNMTFKANSECQEPYVSHCLKMKMNGKKLSESQLFPVPQ